MNEQLKAFEKEIEIIKRMVNGYIKTNPSLAGLEVTAISLEPAAKKKKAGTPAAKTAGKGAIASKGLLSGNTCKICKNAQGKSYCYYGKGPCPTFPA